MAPTSHAPSFFPQMSFKPILIPRPRPAPLLGPCCHLSQQAGPGGPHPSTSRIPPQQPEHCHAHSASRHSPAATPHPGCLAPLQCGGPCLQASGQARVHCTHPSASPSLQGQARSNAETLSWVALGSYLASKPQTCKHRPRCRGKKGMISPRARMGYSQDLY